jgi:hypothetical protein
LLWIVLDACVPEDKKEQLREELDAAHGSVWLDVGFLVLGGILDVTWALVLGWVVHAFLV